MPATSTRWIVAPSCGVSLPMARESFVKHNRNDGFSCQVGRSMEWCSESTGVVTSATAVRSPLEDADDARRHRDHRRRARCRAPGGHRDRPGLEALRDFVAVDEAHFTIGEGEFFSMLGPSGCGKTTTLRMIAGFEHAHRGAIRWRATTCRAPAAQARRQHRLPALRAVPAHVVFDNVAFGPRSQGGGQATRSSTGGSTSCSRSSASRVRQAQARPALRRPAAAGRPRPALVNYPRRSCSTSRSAPSTSSCAR
jgi:hypothetical protein